MPGKSKQITQVTVVLPSPFCLPTPTPAFPTLSSAGPKLTQKRVAALCVPRGSARGLWNVADAADYDYYDDDYCCILFGEAGL